MHHIFGMFHGSAKQGSNGIGLATCKKIVHHYDGEIWVESELGRGTDFYFTLPLALEKSLVS